MTTAISDHLQRIYAEKGELTAALVVDQARPKSHPLHDRFEWNNSVAGEKYRLAQAADLIRSVQIEYAEAEDGTRKKVRGFHSVNRVDGPSYVPIAEIRDDPFMAKLVLQTAEREAKALLRKFGHLQEFMSMLREMVA